MSNKGNSNSPGIEVLVGIKGPTISGASGKLILRQLKSIANEISQEANRPQITFKLNETATKKKLQSQLDNIAKGLKLEIGGTNAGTQKQGKGGSGGTKQDVLNARIVTAKKNLTLLEYKYGRFKTNPELVKEFNALATASNQISDGKQLSKFNQQVRQFSINAQVAGKASKSFGTQVKELIARFSTAVSAVTVFMFLRRYTSEMIENVKAIDSSMVELRKVTEGTDTTYERFLDSASVKAKELHASLTDVIDATSNFARLGYDIPMASNLAEAAIVYKNVGDEIESIDEASQSIISTMQAFNIETSDAMSIVDKFNSVGKLLPMPVVTR